jgi:hypothetical protein
MPLEPNNGVERGPLPTARGVWYPNPIVGVAVHIGAVDPKSGSIII